MRAVDKTGRISRRGLLRRSTAAVILAGIPDSICCAKAAVAFKTIKAPATIETLVVMARDIYPHDRLPNLHYEVASSTIDAGLAADVTMQTFLEDGIAALNAASVAAKGKPYAAIAAEDDRVSVLHGIEATPFFIKIRSALVAALYDQSDVWIKLGYEGSSAEFGGYLHRGFDDIDWLP